MSCFHCSCQKGTLEKRSKRIPGGGLRGGEAAASMQEHGDLCTSIVHEL